MLDSYWGLPRAILRASCRWIIRHISPSRRCSDAFSTRYCRVLLTLSPAKSRAINSMSSIKERSENRGRSMVSPPSKMRKQEEVYERMVFVK